LNFVIDAERCVACLACVRVCPTDAIAVAGDEPLLLQVVDEACIRCGQCLPACPHGAVNVNGEIGRALAIAATGEGVLILSPESVAHFYPATPEQLINACYEAGFRAVTRGVIGDELVAAEYLKLWEEEPWGTLIRSTDPVVVETVRTQYPELLPYLAPVTSPAVAEARYLRAQYGSEVKIAFAGVCPPVASPDLDAAITYGDLDQLFRIRGVNVLSQATFFQRVPEERRRHLSAAGGLPLALLEESRYSSRRFRKIRGLDALPAVARAVAVDRLDLGFVDILSTEGALDHPLSGPTDELYWRRELLASVEAPRSRQPVVDRTVVASVGAVFAFKPVRVAPDRDAVAAVLAQIGRGPNGRPWDCGACGIATCQRFAEAVVLGRASMRQCMPFQERRADNAQLAAAVDTLTGLSTYRVLRDRLAFEVERGKRSSEGSRCCSWISTGSRTSTTSSATRPGTTSSRPWRARSGTRSAPRTWRRATGATSSWSS
jgi:Na+-translocating ferredoxin:NAD+ oxidoreductase RNF subunit RnfB